MIARVVAFCLLALLGASSCQRPPEWLPPPAQRTPPTGLEPVEIRPLLTMSDVDVNRFVRGDMVGAGNGAEYNWTKQHPRFVLTVPDTEGWEFYLRMKVVDNTFKDTGPLTLAIRLNGELLDTLHLDRVQEYEYRHPVPASILRPREEIDVVLDIDPPWIAPTDKVPLGVLLHTVGLRKLKP